MIKAVFLSHTAAPSGAELATMRLLTALRDSPLGAVDPVMVCTEPGPMVTALRARGIPVTVYANDFDNRSMTITGSSPLRLLTGGFSLARIGWRLGALVRDEHADVVVAASVKALLMGALAARRAGVPLVWQVHDRVSAEYFGRLLAPLVRLLAVLCCAGLIANSRATERSLPTRRVPTVVAYPGIEFDADHERSPQRPPADTVVAIVGRLTPWKGQDVALRALAATTIRPRRVLVVGGTFFGEQDFRAELEALAAETGLPVAFTGHVDDPAALMREADILVHCSVLAEPFGQVVVEGMRAGCAVVAADAGGPAEIVESEVDGLLVAPRHDDLVRALDRLIGDRGLRIRLGERARVHARRFDITDSAAVVAGFLTTTVHGAGRAKAVRT
ncbi:glycosyltransferase family 4 protein [Nocardia puris]|uniref:glycosyltransferase family 4 protein n=1 Tax=Nocardia puris TaxID=208602 RepID=UPI001892E272|nr:glycosyltransferase family 4 protein [Nocardia puris]MBF6209869.1 glycosyltransferase family 4 protein [Nocardia puris]MBF6366441.1 glycosyltransferase family 4 protein [Nocardia puris]MBF6458220.1 glycosyltransferase family 4 protein [Nocardia puris]